MTVPPEMERLLREHVEAGRYASVEEALAEAVRLLAESERRRAALGEQMEGIINHKEHGEFSECPECEIDDLFEEVEEEAREKLRLQER